MARPVEAWCRGVRTIGNLVLIAGLIGCAATNTAAPSAPAARPAAPALMAGAPPPPPAGWRADEVVPGFMGAELVAAGRNFVVTHCSTCHAVERSGDSPNAAAPPFRELAARYPLENLAEALGEGIFVGHPIMPQFELEPQEVDAVIAWTRSIQDPVLPPEL